MIVNIIGAGLAGCECAFLLAKNNISVHLYEMKPNKKSEAHTSNDFAELVCSNSLKSESITNACGLLKKEMSFFSSIFLQAAYHAKVEAGQALAVDRTIFSEYITDMIKKEKNITIHYEEVIKLDQLKEGIIVIATGPLTSEAFSKEIQTLLGKEQLYFFDAAAPILEAESIDKKIAYQMDRYGEPGSGDYLNLAMNKEQYEMFYQELIHAQTATRHEFDDVKLFEGCMPIEEMAKRGEKTLTFGMLKPVGLNHPVTGEKNYAVVQLRSENKDKTAYNLVGFQTSLKFKEQERVFRLIPGLEEAKFLRYGVMHKNTYINASNVLNERFQMRQNENIYFAGQISGVEGYVESAACGLMIAIHILCKTNQKQMTFPLETMLGSLSNHVSTQSKDYQPMNANFGILKPLATKRKIKDKKEKYTMYAQRSLACMEQLKEQLKEIK